jgi:hypothetical protein
MEAGEDVVFTRYTWPGIAHIDYWKDYDLFYRILDVSIDNRQQQLAKDEKPQGHYVTTMTSRHLTIKSINICVR